MISKSKKQRPSRKEELISLPNFSEDQKKGLRGVKTMLYSKLADLGHFLQNHLGGGQRKFLEGQNNAFRHEMHEILLKMIGLKWVQLGLNNLDFASKTFLYSLAVSK